MSIRTTACLGLASALAACASLPSTPAVHCTASDACETIDAPRQAGARLDVYGAIFYARDKGKRGQLIALDLRADGGVVINEVDALQRGVSLQLALSRRPSFAAVTTGALAGAGYGELGLHYWTAPAAGEAAAIETVTLVNDSGRASDWRSLGVASTPLADVAQLLPCNRGVVVITQDQRRATLLGFDGAELGFERGGAAAREIDPAWLSRSADLRALPACTGFMSATDGLAWEVWDAGRGLQQLSAGAPADRWVGSGSDELARVSVRGRAYEVEFWSPPRGAGTSWERDVTRSIDVESDEVIADLAGLATGEVVMLRVSEERAAIVVVARDGSTRSRPLLVTDGEQPDLVAAWGQAAFEIHGGRLD